MVYALLFFFFLSLIKKKKILVQKPGSEHSSAVIRGLLPLHTLKQQSPEYDGLLYLVCFSLPFKNADAFSPDCTLPSHLRDE